MDPILLRTGEEFPPPEKGHMRKPLSFCLRGAGVFLGLLASVMAIVLATFAVPVLLLLLLWVT